MDLENSDKDILITQSRNFRQEYKDACFYIWYNAGKPTVKDLLDLIPFPDTNYGQKPTTASLYTWVNDLFIPRAEELDRGVKETLDKEVIAAKVEMLERHAKLGKQMQNLSWEYLEAHKDELTPNSAVRMLVEGRRIEMESIGIPEALLRMSSMTDQELQEEVAKLIEESPIEIEEEDDNS